MHTIIGLTVLSVFFNIQAPPVPAGDPILRPTYADIPYGDHPRQVFDLWIAPGRLGEPAPVCIFIHGGGFAAGDKSQINLDVTEALLDAGISCVSINYRLTEGGLNPYPAAMLDAARVIQTLRYRADQWSLDPDRIACYGGSAGAGISLWLAFHDDLADPTSFDPVARESTRILGAATHNGQTTYDHRTYIDWFDTALIVHPETTSIFGIGLKEDMLSSRVVKLMVDASPITHLSQDDPPVYLLYGQPDTPVDEFTDPEVWIHHARLGQRLDHVMRGIGLESTLVYPGSTGEDPYGTLPVFLFSVLTQQP